METTTPEVADSFFDDIPMISTKWKAKDCPADVEDGVLQQVNVNVSGRIRRKEMIFSKPDDMLLLLGKNRLVVNYWPLKGDMLLYLDKTDQYVVIGKRGDGQDREMKTIGLYDYAPDTSDVVRLACLEEDTFLAVAETLTKNVGSVRTASIGKVFKSKSKQAVLDVRLRLEICKIEAMQEYVPVQQGGMVSCINRRPTSLLPMASDATRSSHAYRPARHALSTIVENDNPYKTPQDADDYNMMRQVHDRQAHDDVLMINRGCYDYRDAIKDANAYALREMGGGAYNSASEDDHGYGFTLIRGGANASPMRGNAYAYSPMKEDGKGYTLIRGGAKASPMKENAYAYSPMREKAYAYSPMREDARAFEKLMADWGEVVEKVPEGSTWLVAGFAKDRVFKNPLEMLYSLNLESYLLKGISACDELHIADARGTVTQRIVHPRPSVLSLILQSYPQLKVWNRYLSSSSSSLPMPCSIASCSLKIATSTMSHVGLPALPASDLHKIQDGLFPLVAILFLIFTLLKLKLGNR